MTDTFALYAVRLPVNDYAIAYVGVSSRPRKRWQSYDRASLIGAAIKAGGAQFEILAWGAKEYIYELERKAITLFATRWPKGYNLDAGGFGGRDRLPSTNAKLSAALSRALRGRPHSTEHTEKVAAAHRGRKRPAGFGQRISIMKRGLIHSPEARLKMSLARKGAPKTPEHRLALSLGAFRRWEREHAHG